MAQLTAKELIERSLRLLNVPGTGKNLDANDENDAFEALQLILRSEAAGRHIQPGIRQHFFNLTAGQSVYSYGPGQDFDTNDFLDPAPVRIESAFIRAGASITSNEQVDEPKFVASTPWTLDTGWTIANELATAAPGNGTIDCKQTLALAAGVKYTLTVKTVVRAGQVTAKVNQNGSPIVTEVITGTGTLTKEFTFGGGTSEIELEADNAGDLDVSECSIIITGKEKVELPDATGSDYAIQIIDQKTYNKRFTKGTGGRPYELIYDRDQYEAGHVRFDNSGLAGDILVMDVRVNSADITSVNDVLRVNPEVQQYLKFELADHVAAGYGKALNSAQMAQKHRAYNLMAAGHQRLNRLRMDKALSSEPRFDINRGDP